VSDYQTALKAWQAGRNAPDPGGAMPEAFRMRPVLRRSAEHVAALERLREWTRTQFKLPEAAAVMAAEVACGLPGCPPLETVVAFWNDSGERHQFKIFKRVEEVAADDLPPTWMKPALLVDEETGFTCC
jgi:nitrate reductase delta subunit